jgi:dTDP-4-dehydrorhamnose reductase
MSLEAMDSPVLVTGATGVVGSATCALLRSSGFEVVALSSSDADLRNFAEVRKVFDRVSPSFR